MKSSSKHRVVSIETYTQGFTTHKKTGRTNLDDNPHVNQGGYVNPTIVLMVATEPQGSRKPEACSSSFQTPKQRKKKPGKGASEKRIPILDCPLSDPRRKVTNLVFVGLAETATDQPKTQ